MFKIYGLHTPMFIKTILGAEEMAVSYEVIPVDLMKGEQKTPQHLARHPFGKVPVLEHEGKFLFEGNTILRYMAQVAKSPLYPNDVYARSLVDQWMDYFSLQAGRWCTDVWFERCVASRYFNQPIDEKLVAESIDRLLTVMPTIDAHLAKNKWFTGKELTLADVNAYMLMMGFADADLNLSEYKNFIRWFNDYKQRPAVAKIAKWLE